VRTCDSCGEQNPERARFCLGCGRPFAPATGPGSRRAVTTLFCDLVSSTELSARLDAETVHDVLTRFYDTARATVTRHGGTVEKFVGDAVMAVFGYPLVHEDDALRAARAALELRRTIEELSDALEVEWGVRLGIRTGVASGEVVAASAATDEPFVVGASVNLAARLEQHAGPGQVLLDEATARLLRRQAALDPVAPLRLKGFGEEPVMAFALRALVAGPADASPHVDRAAELRLLEEALRGVCEARRCRVVNVVGDAGVGKTRLVREFVDGLADVIVLRARCPAYGEAGPLRPLAELVAQAARSSPDDDVAALASALGGVVRDPGVAERVLAAVAGTGGPAGLEERASAVRAFLAALARERPLVLVVDDIHHAEEALLDVLRHLAGWTTDAPILLCCAGRPDLFFEHPSWGRLPGRITVHLEPLTDHDGAELVRALLREAAPEVERRVAEIAGGNPFFIEEVVASLPAGEALTPDDVPVPPTVTALVEARVDRLAEDERRTLERAAVLGVRFRLPELEPLAGPGTAEVVRRLVERDLLVPDPEGGDLVWRFRHALIRDAAYQAIPKQVRAELHVAVAGALADDVRAGSHLERAAETMRELGSRAPAVEELSVAAGTRLASAGRAASAGGDVTSAVGLLERAATLLSPGDPERLTVLSDLQHALLYAGQTERAEAVIEELLQALGPQAEDLSAVRARMQQAYLRFLRDPSEMPPHRLRTILEGSIPWFERAGDDRELAAAFTDLAIVSWVEGRAKEMEGSAERALAAARRSGDPRAVREAAPLLAWALHLGPVPLPDVLDQIAAERGSLERDRVAQSTLLLAEVRAMTLLGRLEEAGAALEDARSVFADLGQRRWLAAADEVGAELARARGETARAISLHREVYAFFLEQRDTLNALPAAVSLAELLCSEGLIAEAEGLARRVEAEAVGEDLEVRVTWMTVRAIGAASRGEAEEADRLAFEALAVADATDFVVLQADARAALTTAVSDPAVAARLRVEALARYEAKGAVRPAAELTARPGPSS
jgi:class 3 adenylate cyclase/type II secretory pathway predicted ATPase ExeA/tetratricopeptide (TPR) repeat protein